MTRTIRLHKKLSEATPWEELVAQTPKKPKDDSAGPVPVPGKADKSAKKPKNDSADARPGGADKSPPKKSKYLQRLEEQRSKKGILLLSRKSEQKIYRIRKALKSKGLPEEKIREELRKVRRTEELKFRKEMADVCLKCRQRGHKIAECPSEGGSRAQAKICYKCGSKVHTSKKCHKKIEGYPYAKCFTCQEVGHLTKDCSKSTKGLYPKGGCCFICKGKTHKMSDCPENRNKKTKESDAEDEDRIVASVYKPGMSMDEEIL